MTARKLANLVGWLCDEQKQAKRLSNSTVGNILDPVRCVSTTAMTGVAG